MVEKATHWTLAPRCPTCENCFMGSNQWTRARATYIQHNTTKIRRLQALALRIMTGAMPSTPFISLNFLTNTPDIIVYLWVKQQREQKGSVHMDPGPLKTLTLSKVL